MSSVERRTNIRTTGYLLAGNTYPVKEQLKGLGAVWDSKNKGWRVAHDMVQQANAIIATAPEREVRAPRAPRRSKSVWRKPCGYPGCSPSYCDECDGEGG